MRRAFLAMGLAAALSACGTPRVASVPAPSIPSEPIRVADGFAACREGLTTSGALFEWIPPLRTKDGCGFDEGIRVRATPSPLNQPATLACPMALALTRFDLDVVQPLAMHHFGKRVTKIHHVGGYHCRAIAGSRKGKWSQHAFANAIDVIGFDLAGGDRLNIARDWRAAGPRAAFLHDVARAACGVFRVVLTPAHDRAHHDHFHLDNGPDRLCGI